MMQQLAWWMRRSDGRWSWPRIVLVAITLLLIMAIVAWLTLWRPAAQTSDPEPARADGDVSLFVVADDGMREQRYALFATLVRGQQHVVWTKRVPAGSPFQVDDIGEGDHTLALTMSPCVKRDCSRFRGGSPIGSEAISAKDRVRLRVHPRCDDADDGTVDAGPTPGIAMLECSRTSVERIGLGAESADA